MFIFYEFRPFLYRERALSIEKYGTTYVHLLMTFAVVSWSSSAVSNLHTTAVKYCIIDWELP